LTRIWPTIDAAIRHSRHRAKAPLTWDPNSHLLSRLTFGPTPADRRRIASHGGADWAERHAAQWYATQVELGRKHAGYSGNSHVARQGPLLHRSPYDVQQWLINHDQAYGWVAMDQLTQVTLGLQAYSVAQLYETLVDFFSNHLNVPNHNGDLWNTRHAYDRDVIRKHAMGSFTDMLLESARHPAMLIYLNIAQSTKNAPNENYGRELLELHTVGLQYKQSDVTNAARMLTGRTVDENQHYLFDDYVHPTGRIRVLDFEHPNARAQGGQAAGDAMLRYLAKHPFTAKHLARKVCVRYVSDDPSDELVSAVAKAYLHSGTKILPMVHTILCSTEFWESRGQKIRRPAENLVATVRALGAGVRDWGKALQSLHWQSSSLGNVPLDWPAPNGYADTASAWRSAGSLLDEWDLHLGFAGGWWDGFAEYDPKLLYQGAKPATSGKAVDLLTRTLTGMRFADPHRRALQHFLGENPSTPIDSSTLRWYLAPLVALILHGPHHAQR
jgi:hypothetical protein